MNPCNCLASGFKKSQEMRLANYFGLHSAQNSEIIMRRQARDLEYGCSTQYRRFVECLVRGVLGVSIITMCGCVNLQHSIPFKGDTNPDLVLAKTHFVCVVGDGSESDAGKKLISKLKCAGIDVIRSTDQPYDLCINFDCRAIYGASIKYLGISGSVFREVGYKGIVTVRNRRRGIICRDVIYVPPSAEPLGVRTASVNAKLHDLAYNTFEFWFDRGNVSLFIKCLIASVNRPNVASIVDPKLLAIIAVESDDYKERQTAVTRLTDQKLLASIAVNDMIDSVRLEAIGAMTDQKLLSEFALYTGSEDIQSAAAMAAVARLSDQSYLRKVALDGDYYVSIVAVRKLTDQDLLAKIATSGHHNLKEVAAVETMTDQALLARVAIHADSGSLMNTVGFAALKRITDKRELEKIRTSAADPFLRKSAAARLSGKGNP